VNLKYSLSGTVGSYLSNQATEAFLASGSEDGDVLVWDITSKEVLWRGRGHSDVVLAVDFGRTKAGKGLLVSGGKDRDVRLWILESVNEDKRDAAGAADTDMDPNMTADMMDVDGMPEASEHVDGRPAAENGMDVDAATPAHENS
jgi:COMPASS component SWD3